MYNSYKVKTWQLGFTIFTIKNVMKITRVQ